MKGMTRCFQLVVDQIFEEIIRNSHYWLSLSSRRRFADSSSDVIQIQSVILREHASSGVNWLYFHCPLFMCVRTCFLCKHKCSHRRRRSPSLGRENRAVKAQRQRTTDDWRSRVKERSNIYWENCFANKFHGRWRHATVSIAYHTQNFPADTPLETFLNRFSIINKLPFLLLQHELISFKRFELINFQ